MAASSEGLVKRRNANNYQEKSSHDDEDKKYADPKARGSDEEDAELDSKETRLTLMEEVLLLGLKDREVCF